MKDSVEILEDMKAAAPKAHTNLRFIKEMPVGKAIRQGDMYLKCIEGMPDKEKYMHALETFQLVEGDSKGSRHTIAEADQKCVTLYERTGFEDGFQVVGYVEASERFLVVHPEHAHFSIPEGWYAIIRQADFAAPESLVTD